MSNRSRSQARPASPASSSPSAWSSPPSRPSRRRLRGQPRHRPAVRRPRRRGRHQHRPSVLNGDLGVSPRHLAGRLRAPAVVNGATHANDGVAAQAQADLTTAYNVAAGQPIPPGNDLTGTDLGGRTLTAGAYGFSTSAQLTGQLTLDAQGDPNAQFVFVIGSTLTTESASSVILTNGASPCNVYWKSAARRRSGPAPRSRAT